MDDLISRQAAIDKFGKELSAKYNRRELAIGFVGIKSVLENLPSAQPEIKPIEYRDCANAMLRMWMDKVVTDGEYGQAE